MAVELKKPSTFQQYKTLLRKDLEQEFRTKEMLTSMGIYALLAVSYTHLTLPTNSLV